MKKVGIVSCYFQHNYGSMLQAYATQMALDKLEIENETIDISGFRGEIKKAKMKYFVKASLTSDILLSKIGMVKNVVYKKMLKNNYAAQSKIRDKKFEAFSHKYFRLSEVYHSKKELGDKCPEKYQAVLVGSDQLWLPGNIAADYYTLNFVPESVNTIAYATSFGQSDLPKDIKKKAAVFLKKIKHISVREQSGQKLAESISGRKVPVVCDPTLLFTGEDWMKIQEEKPLITEPYIMCYFLGNNAIHREFVKRLKAETGCKIVALTHLDEFVKHDENYADEQKYDVDPADFLNLIRNASYVCTDSFHASIFSILYRKNFFSFRRYRRKTRQSTNSRLDTLFHITGITGKILVGDEKIQDVLKTKVDFDMVHSRLATMRAQSYEYLKAALQDERSTDLD